MKLALDGKSQAKEYSPNLHWNLESNDVQMNTKMRLKADAKIKIDKGFIGSCVFNFNTNRIGYMTSFKSFGIVMHMNDKPDSIQNPHHGEYCLYRWSVDEQCEVIDKDGNWWPAKIKDCTGNVYVVRYTDFKIETVSHQRIRHAQKEHLFYCTEFFSISLWPMHRICFDLVDYSKIVEHDKSFKAVTMISEEKKNQVALFVKKSFQDSEGKQLVYDAMKYHRNGKGIEVQFGCDTQGKEKVQSGSIEITEHPDRVLRNKVDIVHDYTLKKQSRRAKRDLGQNLSEDSKSASVSVNTLIKLSKDKVGNCSL